MKKLCSILLALLLSLLLVACGNQNNIQSELIGIYEHKGTTASRKLTFYKDGTYDSIIRFGAELSFLPPDEESGTYEIKGDSIILTDGGGDKTAFTYTYNSDKGELVLYLNNGAYTKK